jgi:hypothetical protein
MQTIIAFRLIEHHFGRIVNSIEGRRIESGLETTMTWICNRHEMKLKQTWSSAPYAEQPANSRPNAKENEMSILSSIGRIATEFSAARARYQTERAIRSLPIELQKDIGWPEATDTKTGTRYGVGTWAGAK